MLLHDLAESIRERLQVDLGAEYDIKLYANELATKEDIERLAIRARAIPNILVNIGPYSVNGTDSDMRADDLSIPIEILFVVSNLRSIVEQKDMAFVAALKVHNILKGETFGTPATSEGYIDGGRLSEVFAFQGFAAYSAIYTINLSVDLDKL